MSGKETETGNVIEQVEWFIKKIKSHDLVINAKANELVYETHMTKSLWGWDSRTLGNCFGIAWEEYEANKTNEALKWGYAETLMTYIGFLYGSNCVDEGEGLTRRYEEAVAERDQNKRDLEQISREYLLLKGRYSELQKRLKQMGINTDGIEP